MGNLCLQGREGQGPDRRTRLPTTRYLPPYSPDLSPIEGALRKTGVRTRGAQIEAPGVAISAVTASDVRDFFEHEGYRLPVELL